jgi:hypothetical protein
MWKYKQIPIVLGNFNSDYVYIIECSHNVNIKIQTSLRIVVYSWEIVVVWGEIDTGDISKAEY